MDKVFRILQILTPLALAYFEHRTKVKQAAAQVEEEKLRAETLLQSIPLSATK